MDIYKGGATCTMWSEQGKTFEKSAEPLRYKHFNQYAIGAICTMYKL